MLHTAQQLHSWSHSLLWTDGPVKVQLLPARVLQSEPECAALYYYDPVILGMGMEWDIFFVTTWTRES